MQSQTLSNSDVIAIFASVIASLALLSTIWQAAIARKHNRLSVQPHLDWFREHTPGSAPALRITNFGLGPAIVQSIQITFDSEAVQLSDSKLPAKLKAAIESANFFTSWDILIPGTPIKAGHEFNLFEYKKYLKRATALITRLQLFSLVELA